MRAKRSGADGRHQSVGDVIGRSTHRREPLAHRPPNPQRTANSVRDVPNIRWIVQQMHIWMYSLQILANNCGVIGLFAAIFAQKR